MSGLAPRADLPCPTHLLDTGEQAIWWGRPDPWRYGQRQAWAALLVGSGVFVIAALIAVQSVREGRWSGVGLVVPVFCAFFAACGALAMSWPAVRFWRARGLTYLLTDRRAIIVEGSAVTDVALAAIRAVEIENGDKPLGSVIFLDRPAPASDSGPDFIRDGFIGIADAEAVAREMRRLQAAAR